MSSIPHLEALCQHYLQTLYATTQTTIVKHLTETSGEMLYPSLKKLLTHVSFTAEDVVLDLGAGKGQMLAQIFLTSPVKAAYGIEIVPDFHQQSLRALKKIQKDFPGLTANRKLEFVLGDFFTLPFFDATVAFMNATCFSQSMLRRLVEKINQVQTLRMILSTRPLIGLQNFSLKKVVKVECSWDSALCYIYLALR